MVFIPPSLALPSPVLTIVTRAEYVPIVGPVFAGIVNFPSWMSAPDVRPLPPFTGRNEIDPTLIGSPSNVTNPWIGTRPLLGLVQPDKEVEMSSAAEKTNRACRDIVLSLREIQRPFILDNVRVIEHSKLTPFDGRSSYPSIGYRNVQLGSVTSSPQDVLELDRTLYDELVLNINRLKAPLAQLAKC